MDANFVYGSSSRKADSLRELKGGLMKTMDLFKNFGLKPLLPPKLEQPDDGCIRPTPSHFCFSAGDNRVNEQLALGVLHTVLVRVHNQIAKKLSEINRYWDDELLYQWAHEKEWADVLFGYSNRHSDRGGITLMFNNFVRRLCTPNPGIVSVNTLVLFIRGGNCQETRHIIAAIVQHITYKEFLPRLLGQETVKRFGLVLRNEGYTNDYDPSVDVTVSAAFSTAAFRFGHSLLPRALEKRSSTHRFVGERRLHEMLQQPYDLYKPGLIDQYILGMASQLAQAMDDSITDEVTNHLFQEPSQRFGKDLATINILRAREHGVPSFMKYRRLCGLNMMDDWLDMVPYFRNLTVNHYLDLYSDTDDIDLWSAGVAEMPINDSLVGPTFSCLIAITFRDLKIGDRFWYENKGWPSSFTPEQLGEIRKITLSRLLCDGGDNIQTIQVNSMEIPHYLENPRVSCNSLLIPSLDLLHWKDYSAKKDVLQEDIGNLRPELLEEENEENHAPNFSLLSTKDGKPLVVPELDKVIQELVDGNKTRPSLSYNEKVKHGASTQNTNKVPYNSWGK